MNFSIHRTINGSQATLTVGLYVVTSNGQISLPTSATHGNDNKDSLPDLF
jgi:hypothetical protein